MMSCYCVCVVLCTIVTSVLGATYTWHGQSTDWGSMTSTAPDAVSSTSVGTAGYKMTTQLAPQPNAYKVGASLTLLGETTLILGDGSSSLTIQFDADSIGSPVALPAPASLDPADAGNFFDYNCNLNWKLTSSIADAVPINPPFVDDDVVINPNANTFYVTTNYKLAGAKSISDGSNAGRTTCTSTGLFALGNAGSFLNTTDQNQAGCVNFFFGSTSWNPPHTTCGADTYLPVNTTVSGTEITSWLYYKGPRAGTLYEHTRASDGSTVLLQKQASSNFFSILRDTPVTGQTTYHIYDAVVVVSANETVLTTGVRTPKTTTAKTTTAAPITITQNSGSAGSRGESGGGGGGMGIIAGAAGAGVVLLVILVVVIMKKKQGGDQPVRTEGVGFENPLYDVSGETGGSGGGGGADGLYSDSVNFEDPAYAQTDIGGGYADLPGGSPADGYLDLDPDLDGFGESDSE